MQSLSARFATLVAGNDLVVENAVTLTVADAPQYNDCTVACESLAIDRQMTTDAPATTRMVSGYPAASATVVLSGLFDRFRTRTNRVPNPSFEVDASLWSIRAGAGGGTIVRSLTRAWIGAASGLYTSGASSVFNSGPQVDIATVVGTTYTVSAYVWVPTGTPAVKAFLLGGAVGASTTVNNAWTRCSVTFTATATTSSVVFGFVPTASGQQFWLDGALGEDGSLVLSYFDGGAVSGDGYQAAWTGTPGLSISTEQVRADSGAGLSALDLYNPYNPASPVYRDLLLGAGVAIGAGLWTGDAVPELAQMFTGYVDSYDVDPLAGTVTFNCIDGRNLLRSVPQFYTTICDPMPVVQNLAGSLFSTLTTPGLTNVYILDSLLRANGFYASPPTRAGAQFYASMAGGGFPQVYNAAGLPTYSDKQADDPGSLTLKGADLAGAEIAMSVLVPGYWSEQVPRSHFTYAACFPSSGNVADSIQVQTGSGWYWEAMVQVLPPWQTGWLDTTGNQVRPKVRSKVVVNSGVLDNASWSAEWVLSGPAGDPIRDPQDAWTFTTTTAGIAHPVTIAPGWHQLGVQVNLLASTSARFRLYVDGVVALDVTEAIDSYLGVLGKGITSTLDESTLPAECITLTDETAAVPTNYLGFVPTAVLDASLNKLVAAPDVSADDAWTVIQSLASSEYGLAGFDEHGVFRFTNRQTLRTQATARTVASDSSLKALAMSAQAASAINRVRVPINSVSIGQYQPLWTGFADDNTQTASFLPAKSSTYGGIIDLGKPFTGLSTYVFSGLFPAPVAVASGLQLVGPGTGQDGSGYRSSKTLNGTGAVVTTGVSWLAYQYTSTSMSMALKNTNAFPVYFVTPAGHGYAAGDVGKPLMLAGGCPIFFGQALGGTGTSTPSAAATTSGAASGLTTPSNAAVVLPDANAQWVVDGAAENAIQVPANQWVQDPTCAQQLAEDLLADLVYPRPVLTNVGIVADPRLQLADRLHIADPDASGMDDDAITFGISTAISDSDWSQTLSLRAIGQPGYWVLGQSGHSELALTTWM